MDSSSPEKQKGLSILAFPGMTPTPSSRAWSLMRRKFPKLTLWRPHRKNVQVGGHVCFFFSFFFPSLFSLIQNGKQIMDYGSTSEQNCSGYLIFFWSVKFFSSIIYLFLNGVPSLFLCTTCKMALILWEDGNITLHHGTFYCGILFQQLPWWRKSAALANFCKTNLPVWGIDNWLAE